MIGGCWKCGGCSGGGGGGVSRCGGWHWWQSCAGDTEVTVGPSGRERHEARLVGGDLGPDPGLVLGYSGVDSWKIRPGTTFPKTDDSRLNPATALLDHHWTS